MTFTLLGLILNILGTAIVWWFGLPAHIGRDGRISLTSIWGGEPNDAMKETINRVKRHARLSNLGMFLIVVGFILQALDLNRVGH